MDDLVESRITTRKKRVAIAVVGIVGIILGWASASRQFGNLLVETTSYIDPYSHDIARLALKLAPGDPQVHHLYALTAGDPNLTIAELENVIRISPSDFRWRVALGRAYEEAEQIDKAEQQFKRAVALAPTYAFAHWNLGNFYLRQGREDEAIADLRMATVGHFGFREQVFSLAWDYFDGNPHQVERIASDDAETRAYLARFFAQRGEGDAALRVWDGLEHHNKEKYRSVGSLVLQELYGKGDYVEAQEIARQLETTNAIPEAVSNPSFEDALADGSNSRFGWDIVPGDNKVDIAVDNQNRVSGSRSIRLSFRGVLKSEFVNLFQAVVVQPLTDYTLSFHIRTEGLRSPIRPVLQIVSANDNVILAATEMFPPDAQDWRKIEVPFRSGPNTTAISIRTFRQICGDQCSMTGSLWYDDFNLSRK